MPVVKLSDDVFFRQFIPDLTPNTAKQEVRRRLSPDYDPAARYRAMLDTPEVQADPHDLMALRSIVESYEMLHDHDYGRAIRAMQWLDQTGIGYELKLHTRRDPRHNAIRVTVNVKLDEANAAMFKLYRQ